MMSYECFETLMDTLRDYWDNMCVLESNLGVQFEENWMTDHFDKIVEAITNDFEGPDEDDIDEKIGPIVLYWAFDMNWGEEKNIIPYKGVNYEVKHLEDLYNMLFHIEQYREAGFEDNNESPTKEESQEKDFLEKRYMQIGGTIDIA